MSTIIIALFFAIGLSLIGEILRMITPGLRKILLPGAVLGGVLALILGPQVLKINGAIGVGDDSYDVLSQFPPLFITIVFATLMLGRPVHGLKKIWARAKRQVVMGHIYAWGQYVVGISLLLFVIGPALGVNILAGTTIAIGFQGGHGTAAGLTNTFNELGFPEGKTIAYALATFGIIAGTILGPLLANFHLSRNDGLSIDEDKGPSGKEIGGGEGEPETEGDRPSVEFSPLTGGFTVQLAIVGCVILVGYGILEGFTALESSLRSGESSQSFVSYIPLFSVVLIVGLAAQVVLQMLGLDHLLNRSTLQLISAFALDMVIFGALASLNLSVVGDQWLAILILCLVGLSWNLAVFHLIGPRIYPRPWYAYALGDLGGGTATTASGLLLIRIVDPENRTQARAAYTEKQPFYEPFMGGGLVTAFALPIVASLGGVWSLVITSVVLCAFGIYAWILSR